MKTRRQVSAAIQKKHDEAYKIGVEYIEKEARRILLAHPSLEEFIMGMGAAFFTTKKLVPIGGGEFDNGVLELDERRYFHSLNAFMFDWDIIYGFSGEPMRFTASGPKITDW